MHPAALLPLAGGDLKLSWRASIQLCQRGEDFRRRFHSTLFIAKDAGVSDTQPLRNFLQREA